MACNKQDDPSESWYIEQNDVWLNDDKMFYHRPMRCVIVVRPLFLAQDDTALSAESACLSCANICIDDPRFSPDSLLGQACDVEQGDRRTKYPTAQGVC